MALLFSHVVRRFITEGVLRCSSLSRSPTSDAAGRSCNQAITLISTGIREDRFAGCPITASPKPQQILSLHKQLHSGQTAQVSRSCHPSRLSQRPRRGGGAIHKRAPGRRSIASKGSSICPRESIVSRGWSGKPIESHFPSLKR